MKSTSVSLRNGTGRSTAKSTNGGRCYGMKQSTVNINVGVINAKFTLHTTLNLLLSMVNRSSYVMAMKL